MRKFVAFIAIIEALGASGVGLAQSARADDESARWECKGVSVLQQGPTQMVAGGKISYEIAVENRGDCDLNDVSVTDFIPRLSVFAHASPAPSSIPSPEMSAPSGIHPVNSIQWNKLSLTAGASAVFQIVAEVKSPNDPVLINTACAESPRTGRVCSVFQTDISQ